MLRRQLRSGLAHVGLALREPEEFARRWHEGLGPIFLVDLRRSGARGPSSEQGLGMATAVFIADSRQTGGSAAFRVATSLVFWPLYFPPL